MVARLSVGPGGCELAKVEDRSVEFANEWRSNTMGDVDLQNRHIETMPGKETGFQLL